jgi:putative RNA 2'-phosphotransferase
VDRTRVSKRLSYVLRHAPDSVGLDLDRAGWVAVDDLLRALAAVGLPLSDEQLRRVVEQDDKGRFAFDATRTRVRANQGHSVPVDLGYVPQTPPDVLFHGTPVRSIDAILSEGLSRRNRHAVHLSPDVRTAALVGGRRGHHVVLVVDAAAMAADGAVFTRSPNGVWLVDAVAPQYLRVLP